MPYTPNSAVGVYGSEVQSLHVVQSDWRVDHEAEESSSDEIPECDGDKEVAWPSVGADPRVVSCAAGESNNLPSLEPNENEWDYFQCTEHRSQR